MEGTAGGVVGAQYAVVEGRMAHGAFGCKALRVEFKKVSAHDVVTQSVPGDGRHEFDALLYDLQR